MANSQLIFGVPVTLPQEWENWSVYRYVAASSAQGRPKAGFSLRPTKAGPELHTSMTVARQGRFPEAELARFFANGNQRMASQDSSYKVLKSGVGSLRKAKAGWQDVTFVDRRAQIKVFQRHLALINPAGEAVVITLTGNMTAITQTAKEIGFEG